MTVRGTTERRGHVIGYGEGIGKKLLRGRNPELIKANQEKKEDK